MQGVVSDQLRDQNAPAPAEPAPPSMRRYVAVLAILFIALAAPLAGVIFWLARPFDAMATPAQLADIQARRPDAIILPVDLRYNAAFKLARAAQVQPEIVCFGSSRAGGFRAAMFAPRRFYNLSFTAWTTDQLLDIFDRTTRQVHPRVAILELDYFLFADRWERWFATTRTMIHDRPFRYAMASLGSFLRTTASNRSAFEAYERTPTAFVGPQSIQSQEGFRSDGSYAFSEAHIADAQQRYRSADFFGGSTPAADQMSSGLQAPVARLAELARQRGIKLVAVQLPLIRAGIDLLEHDESYHARAGAWRDFESESTRAWLAGLGIPLFDLARSPIDDDPDNFVDALHLSESGMDKAMRELQADPAFRAAIDPGAPSGPAQSSAQGG
jgi:hypothetical protein